MMTAGKVACPHCRAGLKSARPVDPGAKVKCPRCGAPFTVPGMVSVTEPSALTSRPPAMGILVPSPAASSIPGAVPPPNGFRVPSLPPVEPAAPSVAPPRRGRKALGFLIVALAGVALAGLAFLLVGWCFSPGAPDEAGKEVASGEEDPGPSDAVAVPRKPAPAPLIVLTPEEEHTVDETLVRGVGYLKQSQDADGSWPGDGKHRVGYAALAALTLVECGVPVDDPCIQKATEFIRARCPSLNQTYELALVLLFLNRLGDGADRDRIQKLALRVVAGQLTGGGWGYTCPVLNDEDHDKLLVLLRDLNAKEADGARRAQPTASVPVPPRLGNLAVLHDDPSRPAKGFRGAGGDNSNTQFAVLALWTARGHDLPVDRSLALLVRHFQASQNTDGSWGYGQGRQMVNLQGNPTMTCAGLLGLAVGHGLAAESRKSGMRPAEDAGIHKALQVVAKKIDTSPAAKKPSPRSRQLDMYFLWSVERVAVLFQLKTIGDKRWYHWGMEQLVKRQQGDGGWEQGGGHGGTRAINTCFAMLFLKRVNLAKDLTDKITAVVAALPPGPARKQ
jgi:hypothetical protein